MRPGGRRPPTPSAPEGQGRHSFTAQQQTLRRLNLVFAAYFKRVREAEQRARSNGERPDAGWAQFASILSAKAESAGRRVIRVDPSYASVTCHTCGTRCSRPRQDTVVCPAHGELDADLNGARNIATRAGLGSGQAPAA